MCGAEEYALLDDGFEGGDVGVGEKDVALGVEEVEGGGLAHVEETAGDDAEVGVAGYAPGGGVGVGGTLPEGGVLVGIYGEYAEGTVGLVSLDSE